MAHDNSNDDDVTILRETDLSSAFKPYNVEFENLRNRDDLPS